MTQIKVWGKQSLAHLITYQLYIMFFIKRLYIMFKTIYQNILFTFAHVLMLKTMDALKGIFVNLRSLKGLFVLVSIYTAPSL